MTIEELTEIASDFLRDNYVMELAIPIVRNNRLRTTMASYVRNPDYTPHSIEIAGYMFEYAAREALIDTLHHECVHYALHMRGEPHHDGQPHFEAELKRLGVGATETNIVGIYVVYTCEKCGKESETRGRRLLRDYQGRVTHCCRGEIQIVGERIYNGTEAV